MPMNIKTLWREPLLHFLLLGFALFLYYELTAENVEAPPKSILVEQGEVQQLAANFERTWQRPPSPAELDWMIEGHVREEVFYREALSMGLDREDPIVRRRMRMKLEFMLEDLASQTVDDKVLEAYLQQNAEDFREETKVSFSQVFLDPDSHANLTADAAVLLKRLEEGADPVSLGDPTLAPRNYQLARKSEIERDFGAEFSNSVVSLPPGEWSGPYYSPFGAHLVMVDNRVDTRVPALDEVREQVLREYHAEQRQQQKDIAYQKLRETYEVIVEPAADIDSAADSPISEARMDAAE